MLSINDEQAFSLSADAGKVIQNIEGRYLKDRSVDDSLYLKAYSGDLHRVDRVTRPSIQLESPCMTILWLTQPDKAERLLGNESLAAGGFLPRFLMCDTRATPTEIPENEFPVPNAIREAYETLVRSLLETYWKAKQPFTIPDSPGARRVLREFHNRLVKRRRADLGDVNSFVARWQEQAWRIAIVLHAALCGREAHLRQISEQTALDAIKLAEWFGDEQLRLLAETREVREMKRLERLIEVLQQRYPAGASLRDLYLRHNLKSEEVKQLAAKFPHHVTIQTMQPGATGGRPSEVVKIV